MVRRGAWMEVVKTCAALLQPLGAPANVKSRGGVEQSVSLKGGRRLPVRLLLSSPLDGHLTHITVTEQDAHLDTLA